MKNKHENGEYPDQMNTGKSVQEECLPIPRSHNQSQMGTHLVKSSDPDDKSGVPKARLVLIGWEDPELGKIAADSPTLRKESKHLALLQTDGKCLGLT